VATRHLWGAWLGAQSARLGRRIVYTPLLLAQYLAERPATSQPSREEVFEFLSRHHDLVTGDRYYPRFLQLQRGRGFDLAQPGERAAILNTLLAQLEGPHEFLDQIEVNPHAYAPAKITLDTTGGALPTAAGELRLRAA
jgi:hypothetical protein